MPYINKINVGGTDYDVGGTIVELTEAEYDALPEEQKMNGIVYSVGDPDDDGTTSAAVVSYDNTTSGLTAENVQDAVDEINSDLTNLEYITQLGYIASTTPTTITLTDAISNYRWVYVALVLNDNHYAPTLIPTVAIVSQQILISTYDGSNHYAYFTKTSDNTIYGVSNTSGYSLAFWGVGKK